MAEVDIEMGPDSYRMLLPVSPSYCCKWVGDKAAWRF